MTKETLTIHEALSELKTLDARISKVITSGKYVDAVKHSAEKINGMTREEYKTKMRADLNKALDLIARRNAIKRAVVLSNAKTEIEINGVKMSVAEAIECKNHGMEQKQALLYTLTSQNDVALLNLRRNSGDEIERRAEEYVKSVIAAQPKDSKMSVDSDAMQAIRKQYIENNAYDYIDPNGIDKLLENLTNEISVFNTKVDSALSVSNALTTIEIEY